METGTVIFVHWICLRGKGMKHGPSRKTRTKLGMRTEEKIETIGGKGMKRRGLLLSLVCLLVPAVALAAPNGYFDLEPNATLETGDSWVAGGSRYRLFGVQSFPRGTTFTNKVGEKQDRGDASLALLSAYIKDTAPVCAPVARAADVTYVTCYAMIRGNRLDLAMILIESGFASAALREDGRPSYAPYAAAESQAREHGVGLWQFNATPDE